MVWKLGKGAKWTSFATNFIAKQRVRRNLLFIATILVMHITIFHYLTATLLWYSCVFSAEEH